MNNLIIEIFIAIIVLILIYKYRENKKQNIVLKNNYGKFANFKITDTKIENISKYYKATKSQIEIDDITYQDLDLEKFYKYFNNSISFVGNEYTYKAIRDLKIKEDTLLKRNELSNYFNENTNKRVATQKALLKIGKQTNYSLYEKLMNVKKGNKKIYLDIILLMAFLLSICVAIYNEKFGFLVVITACINIVTYLKQTNAYNSYSKSFSAIINMRRALKKIIKINRSIKIEDEQVVKSILKKLKWLGKYQFLISSENSDIISILLSYINMILHLDIIVAYLMLRNIRKNIDNVIKLYEIIGEIDFVLNIASFRNAVEYYTTPEFNDEKKIEIKKLRHPLLSDGITNDIDIDSSILITGSNASGKSTFLKSVAINQILAQTIYTVIAQNYTTTFFNIKSSMALRDDLFSNESYFMVEIKSIKRLLDNSCGDIKLLCFIDEILRGTNTLERICASKVILEELAHRNCLCITATHDIELTHLLENSYVNYHFSEKLIDNDVVFDYKIKQGRSRTKNAIALLGVMGFDKKIIDEANREVSLMGDRCNNLV